MEDFIKELQFLPKINFVAMNSVDAVSASNPVSPIPDEIETGEEE